MAENLLERAINILSSHEECCVVNCDDSWSSLDEIVRARNIGKIAVFTGRNSADASGSWSKLVNALGCCEVPVVRFKDIPAEPDMETVEQMKVFLQNENPDTVIALGGGSVLDAAKAAYITFQSSLALADCFGSNRISETCPDRKFKRIIAIPTTSGTGSEITQYSNIVNRNGGVKQLISDPVLVPEFALLDGALTCSMPRSVTLATGCDALAHLLEGWLNVTMDEGNEKINTAAAAGVALLKEYLPAALEHPADKRARKAVQLAAALGGLTIRHKSTGLPHLLSFSWFGRIEHGIAVARILPAAWRYYIGRSTVAERTLEIGKVLGGDTADAVIAAYEQLLSAWEVPLLKDFPDLNIELMQNTCRSAGANRMKLELAPRPVPLEESEKVLHDILCRAWREF